MVTYEIELCIGKADQGKAVTIKCHDTGAKFWTSFVVCRAGKYAVAHEPYTIPAGTTAVLKITKPDKNYVIADGEVSGGGVLFSPPTQAFTAAGTSKAEVSLFGADGNRITTATFYIEVPEECVCDCQQDSEPYVDVMAKQIQAAIDAAKAAEEAAERAEAAGGGGGGGGGSGADGFSPDAKVSQTAEGAVITITDKEGTTTATVYHGKDGKDGINGKDGRDGYTPVKGVDYFDGKDGKNGEDGYTPQKGVDYFDGSPGTPGKDGAPGKDGITPAFSIGTVSTLAAGSNATASISGTAAAPVLNLGIPKGADGKDGGGGSGGGAGEVWRLLRTISFPADPSTDKSGIEWLVDDAGRIRGCRVATDSNGDSFTCKKLYIRFATGCSDTSTSKGLHVSFNKANNASGSSIDMNGAVKNDYTTGEIYVESLRGANVSRSLFQSSNASGWGGNGDTYGSTSGYAPKFDGREGIDVTEFRSIGFYTDAGYGFRVESGLGFKIWGVDA